MWESVQPIVLVGGRSRRFGRDKLREPVGDERGGGSGEWLVDRPIRALREVFGARVALVGECDPAVAARGDGVIADVWPGAGPAGGVLSALDATQGDVFVLAGDLLGVTAASVRAVMAEAERSGEAWAVLARSDHPEPCIGLYRRILVEALRMRLREGRGSLHDLVPAERVRLVGIDPAEAVNINTPGGLDAVRR